MCCHPPHLTTVVSAWETKATDLGALGSAQESSLRGVSEQQNDAEIALENAAFPLARKLRLYYKAQGQLDKAAAWAMPKSEWQRMREDALLAKAKALRDEVTPLTTSLPPAGGAFGLTADVLAAFSLLVDAYEEEIGKPGTARSQRKAQGAELRPRYALADVDLDDIDDLIEDLRDKGDAEHLFVETYFNLRRLGAGGSDGGAGMNKGGPAKPTPPAPPAPPAA